MNHDSEPVTTDHDHASVEPGSPVASDITTGDERLVPVAEARKYRKRAQAAEKILEDLQRDLEAKNELLAQRERALEELERARQLDELLVDAASIDLETTRLLTERALAEMEEPDAAQAVDDLVRHKPFLFHTSVVRGGASSPHGITSPEPAPVALEHAAVAASTSGRRSDLLRYLRLRRKV